MKITPDKVVCRLRRLAVQADKRALSNKRWDFRLRAEGQAKAYWNALSWIEMIQHQQ